MKKVLIYYPFNIESVAIQSQAELMIRLGYEVYLLTWLSEGKLHERCREKGVKVYSSIPKRNYRGVFFFINQVYQLVKFTRKHKITLVFAHLQSVAMTAGLAKYFRNLDVWYFRHNSDYLDLQNSKKQLFINKLANIFPNIIVAISEKVKLQLIKEGVKPKKIVRIDLCYDFADYGKASKNNATEIRQQYPSDILLLTAARLDELKRHILGFEVVEKLLRENIKVKLLCIGNGPEKQRLEEYIVSHGLTEHIFMLGFATNAIDYFSACDILLHPSYSEASSHVAKEAGSCGRTVIVCHNVGDFDDYLVNKKNAFLVDKEQPVDETVAIIKEYAQKPADLQQMGKELFTTVHQRFSIEKITEQYLPLLRKKS